MIDLRNTKFRVPSPEISKAFQKQVFVDGVCWPLSSPGVQCTDKSFLYIDGDKRLSFGNTESHFLQKPYTEVFWDGENERITVKTSPAPRIKIAPEILQAGVQHMTDRAALRDTPEGERSMAKAVAAFNILHGTDLTETQGWRFMSILKHARSVQGSFCIDDYEDEAAYAALAAESEQKRLSQQNPEV